MAAISSNKIVSAQKFHAYAIQTAEMFLKSYPQFTFSPTVHKLLYHGADYIARFPSISLGKTLQNKVLILKWIALAINLICGLIKQLLYFIHNLLLSQMLSN